MFIHHDRLAELDSEQVQGAAMKVPGERRVRSLLELRAPREDPLRPRGVRRRRPRRRHGVTTLLVRARRSLDVGPAGAVF
jgi:hypothetical protein